MRILIVEDEKKIADFIKRGLKEEGYSADIAHDGEKGHFLASTGLASVHRSTVDLTPDFPPAETFSHR